MAEIRNGILLKLQEPDYAMLDGKHCAMKDMEHNGRYFYHFIQAYQYNEKLVEKFQDGYFLGEDAYALERAHEELEKRKKNNI